MNRAALAGWGVLAAVFFAVTVWLFPDGTGGGDRPLPLITAGAPTSSLGVAQSADRALVGVGPAGAAGSPAAGSSAQIARAANVAAAGTGEDVVGPTDAVQAYIGPHLQLHEAHWQGMDTRKLDQELRRKLKYPRGLQGILVTEVTLNAAKAGLLAGDVIVAVDGTSVTTLEEFQQATKMVRQRPQAELTVFRKLDGQEGGRHTMKRKRFVLSSRFELGFAQVEGAPMILPGDMRPHPERGPCTSCHAVGEGFELTPDPDLIVLPPPPISSAAVAEQLSPHRDRGPCKACHVVTR